MSTMDMILLAVIAVSTLFGAFRGGVKEIFSILAIVLGIAGGIYFHAPIAAALGGSGAASVAAFAAVFLVVAAALHIVARVLQTMLKLMFLGGMDRFVGAAVGLVRGLILVGLVWGLCATYLEKSKQWAEDSKLSFPALKGVELVSPTFPGELRDRFQDKYHELRDLTDVLRDKAKQAEDALEKVQELEQKVEQMGARVKGE